MNRAAEGEIRDSPSDRATMETRTLPQSSAPLPPLPSLPVLPWRQLLQCTLLAASMLFLFVCASDLYLLSSPLPTGIGVRADADDGSTAMCILGAAKQLITPPTMTTGTAAGEVARRLAAAGDSLASCWAVRIYSSQVLLDDATPNIGQWWYLAMEAFDDTKVVLLGQVLGLTLWVDRLARGKERLLDERPDERRQEAQKSTTMPEADGAKS
ncbi:hypothetical protein Vafri_17704 [Volvox africanus]|uniref:Uncharacterized protein n=1 Tax=Volvox africanus TaxID=51714 RepID=A0A8J4BR28_9CHLO|nr:hypothetical protein Vafri_17704 [Volvox africanus]